MAAGTNSANGVIELFASAAAWLAPHRPGASLESTIAWVVSQIDKRDDGSLARRLRDLVQLDHPSRVRAERHVVRLLGLSLQTDARYWRQSDFPLRDVDWPRTVLDACGRVPQRYWCAARKPTLDSEIMAGLASLARDWLRLLDELGDRSNEEHERRRADLKGTLASLPREARRSGRYRRQHELRLTRHDQGAARSIRECLDLLERALGNAPDDREETDMLERAFAQFAAEVEREGEERGNEMLFESYLRMAVGRAAADEGYSVVTSGVDETSGGYAGTIPLVSSDGAVECVVGKGAPLKISGDAYEDRLKQYREAAGLGAYDRQPDLVVRFSLRCEKRHEVDPVFFFGDAKYSASEGYLKQAIEGAVGYLIAYREAIGLSVTADDKDFSVQARPAFTVFFWQRPENAKLVGSDDDDGEMLIEVLYSDASDGDQRDLSSRLGLGKWFHRIAECAQQKLKLDTL